MPRFIVKLEGEDGPWYLEWSTIVDAPVTRGMTLGDFQAYYREKYGTDGMRGLADRLARVEDTGCSTRDGETGREMVSYNRAGEGESQLTYEQLVEAYCRQKSEVG